jgi:hypothetical protein
VRTNDKGEPQVKKYLFEIVLGAMLAAVFLAVSA